MHIYIAYVPSSQHILISKSSSQHVLITKSSSQHVSHQDWSHLGCQGQMASRLCHGRGNTFTFSRRNHTAHTAREVTAMVEERKLDKYRNILHTHIFIPVVIEILGVIGPTLLTFLKDLIRRIRYEMGEENLTSYILQQISDTVMIQCQYWVA